MSARTKALEERINRELADLILTITAAPELINRTRHRQAFDAVTLRIARACEDAASAILSEISTAGAVLDGGAATAGFEELAELYELRGRAERDAKAKFDATMDLVYGRWTAAASGVRAIAARLRAGQSPPRDAIGKLFGLASSYAGVRW